MLPTQAVSRVYAESDSLASNEPQQQQSQQGSMTVAGATGTTAASGSIYETSISKLDAIDIIVNFKRHLLEKWKKNKAKQHVNKIIHYHLQHTFFLRYGAPLFLAEYAEVLQANLAREAALSQSANGSTSAAASQSAREQGLIATLKQINADILNTNNTNKKTKSVDVLEAYLNRLTQSSQLDAFLDVLVYVMFNETPHAIPAELSEKKSNNLFHFVSPIISFLIIFYIHVDKKPLTLDELVTRSGLKQLYKNVRVPFALDQGEDESSFKGSQGNNNNNNDEDDDNDGEEDDPDYAGDALDEQPQSQQQQQQQQPSQQQSQSQADNAAHTDNTVMAPTMMTSIPSSRLYDQNRFNNAIDQPQYNEFNNVPGKYGAEKKGANSSMMLQQQKQHQLAVTGNQAPIIPPKVVLNSAGSSLTEEQKERLRKGSQSHHILLHQQAYIEAERTRMHQPAGQFDAVNRMPPPGQQQLQQQGYQPIQGRGYGQDYPQNQYHQEQQQVYARQRHLQYQQQQQQQQLTPPRKSSSQIQQQQQLFQQQQQQQNSSESNSSTSHTQHLMAMGSGGNTKSDGYWNSTKHPSTLHIPSNHQVQMQSSQHSQNRVIEQGRRNVAVAGGSERSSTTPGQVAASLHLK